MEDEQVDQDDWDEVDEQDAEDEWDELVRDGMRDGTSNEGGEWVPENASWRNYAWGLTFYIERGSCSFEEVNEALQNADEFCTWRMFLHHLCQQIYSGRCNAYEVTEWLLNME